MDTQPQDKLQIFFGDADESVRQEFLRNVKIRSIEQKFLYFGEGAERYYVRDSYRPDDHTSWTPQEMFDAIKDSITKEERVGFISLGCGIARRDRDVMHLLHEAGYNFQLIAVDSSASMIEHAGKLLEQEPFDYKLWVEDLTTYDFYERASKATEDFDKVVFIFLGSTIGNMIQTEIVDTLYNIMRPGHLLWFDNMVRQTNNKIGDLELFNRYAERLHNEDKLNFMFYPLEILGIPREVGTMMMENLTEESIGVLTFRFSFRFKEPCTVHFHNEYIHFIPPERIKLLDIRAYHADTMINYFEQHDFKLTKKIYKGIRGQFIFMKA